MRKLGPNPVKIWGFGLFDQVAEGVFFHSPTIQNEKKQFLVFIFVGNRCFDQRLTRHLCRFFQAQQFEKRGRHIAQLAKLLQDQAMRIFQCKIGKNERDRILGVPRVHCAIRILPFLYSAVVCTHHKSDTSLTAFIHQPCQLFVHDLHCPQHRLFVLDVAQYIHIGKISHDNLDFWIIQLGDYGCSDFFSAHLRCQSVGIDSFR